MSAPSAAAKELAPETPKSTSLRIPEWMTVYCQQNPLKVLYSICLVASGLILFAHFLRIGYLPIFDPAEVLGVLLSLLLLSILLLFSICIFALLPGWTILGLSTKGIIRNPDGAPLSRRFVIATAFFLGSMIPILVFYAAGMADADAPASWLKWVIYAASIALPAAFIAIHVFAWKLAIHHDLSEYLLICGVVALVQIWTFSVVALVGIHGTAVNDSNVHWAVLGLAAISGIVNALPYFIGFGNTKHFQIVPVLVFVFALTPFGVATRFQTRIFTFFKVGELNGYSLVVNREGCEVVSLAASGINCEQPSVTTSSYRFLHLEILTRLGPDMLISAYSGGEMIRFSIPKSMVLSMSRCQSEKIPWRLPKVDLVMTTHPLRCAAESK